MIACAEWLGRDKSTCTRGTASCLCYIESLQQQNERFKDLLRQIGYPRRGTAEEDMDIFDAAKLIQANFSLDELEER